MRRKSLIIQETHIVGRMEKDDMRHIKARRLLVDGAPMVDLRVFVIDAKGHHKPTPAGFWFPPAGLVGLKRLVERLIAVSPEAQGKE